jgi:tetratricopeptide (TPR) repeat protein
MVAGSAGVTVVAAAFTVLSTVPCSAQGTDAQRERAQLGTVRIQTGGRGGSIGTGIIVGISNQDIYIVTAEHVLPAEAQADAKVEVQFKARPGEWSAAKIVKRNGARDIAALRVPLPGGLRAEQLTGEGSAPQNSVSRGTDVYPVGSDREKEALKTTVTADKVASVERDSISVQSVYVTNGFSGGPLLDTCGRVVAMVTATSGRDVDALPIDLVVDVLKGWSLPVSAMAVKSTTCGTVSTAAATPPAPAAPATATGQSSITDIRRMHRDQQWRESLPLLTKMLAEQPGNPELYALRSHAYSHLELPTEALADGEKAVQLAPRSAEAYLRRGEAKHGDHRFVEALADYDKSLELDKNDAEAWGNKGSALQATNQPQKALDALNRAIELQKNRYEFWVVRASVNSSLKNYNAAVSDATQAIQLRPGDPQLLTERATAYANLNQFEHALGDTNNALKAKPEDPDLLALRGNIYLLQGRRAAAREDLNRALQLKPSLTYISDLLKKLDAGEKPTTIETTNKTAPAGASPALAYARTLDDAKAAIGRQRNAEANELLNQLIRIDPARSEAWSIKGALALNAEDNPAAAHEYYENALARGGNVVFRVAHDHGQDQAPCFGSMSVSPAGVSYSSDGGHRFNWPYAQIAEADLNKLYGMLIGMFHLRVQVDRRSLSYNFAAMRFSDDRVVERKADAELLTGFINRLRQASR